MAARGIGLEPVEHALALDGGLLLGSGLPSEAAHLSRPCSCARSSGRQQT
jgi:hypothetical protein